MARTDRRAERCGTRRVSGARHDPGTGSGKYTAQIVAHGDLARLANEHPYHSFLVPGGQDETLRRALRPRTTLIGWFFTQLFDGGTEVTPFKVERRPDGRQFLTVQSSDEKHLYVGWYIATDREIEPQHFTSFYETVAFGLMPVDMWRIQAPTTAVVLLIGLSLSWRLTRKRARSANTGAPPGGRAAAP